ncbi:MAG: lysophospholipid acyltransferase family protein [Thermodesulfobacteriota bacterium]
MTIPRWIKGPVDLLVTLFLWVYFTFGYFILFSPFYLFSFLFSDNLENSFQKINHRFFKSFFILLRIITPRLNIRIDDDVCAIRSSVIVCNHLSYLDPILMVSLFEKQKTVVKKTFLKVPVFGWVLKKSGYLFSTKEETFTALMLERIKDMENYLSSGGNLFVFPEGTRSRDGKIGRLNKGAFTIAKRYHAPIQVLMINQTNKLLKPGRSLLNTCVPITIEVKRIGSIPPEYTSDGLSIQRVMEQVRQFFEQQLEP